MAVSSGTQWYNSSEDATYGIILHEEFEILHRQKLVDFENGRTRREAHQSFACCPPSSARLLLDRFRAEWV